MKSCKRTVWDLENPGKIKSIEVNEHSFAYSGNVPCTGVYRCVYCGYVPDKKGKKPS